MFSSSCGKSVAFFRSIYVVGSKPPSVFSRIRATVLSPNNIYFAGGQVAVFQGGNEVPLKSYDSGLDRTNRLAPGFRLGLRTSRTKQLDALQKRFMPIVVGKDIKPVLPESTDS